MNRKTRLALAIALACSAPLAQATTYNVSANFADGGVQGPTLFNGSFDWDGTKVSNFQGLLGASMWAWNTATQTFTSGMNGVGMSMPTQYLGLANNCPGNVCTGYAQNEHPWLSLNNQLVTSVSGNYVTVTTFKVNSTDVVAGGGYDVSNQTGSGFAYGYNPSKPSSQQDQTLRNNNAFFTMVFDKNDPTNTTMTWNDMAYADMTRFGMMGGMVTGWVGMTGFKDDGLGTGSMGGEPHSLTISAAVPEPATYAMMMAGLGLLGLVVPRRRTK